MLYTSLYESEYLSMPVCLCVGRYLGMRTLVLDSAARVSMHMPVIGVLTDGVESIVDQIGGT